MRTPHSLVRSAAVLSLLAVAAASANAADIDPSLLTQPEFRLLAEDLGAASSFKPMIPAESLGITGFDIGVAVTGTRLQNRDAWKKATNDANFSATLPVAMLRVHKGLPFDIDFGGSIAKVPTTNIQVIGGELRWAALAGGIAVPAIAVRASVSAVSGVSDLSLRTAGLDVSISKGFAFLTPYAGAGIVNVKTNPNTPGLVAESFNESKVFAGLNLNLGLTNIVLETDKTGQATSYGVKFGFRF